MSDLLKILDNVPVWKQLRGLPARVAELEARLAALEGTPATPPWRSCTLCGATLDVISEAPHVHFGYAGVKTLKMRCGACGAETDRMVDPRKG